MSNNEKADTSKNDSRGVAEIEADIARHRAELGQTVDELSARFDVKKQAKAQVENARQAVQDASTSAADQAKSVVHSVEDQAKGFQARAKQASPRELAAMLAPAAIAVAGVAVVITLVRRPWR
ncbi:DUF3618 domain-containing protein [Demequina aurantiaca]|uniref:DUF3618 domain-containing protein n=1 Tax=Demequina aurantiaca TaxID=676200 RepID=UPI003D3519F5